MIEKQAKKIIKNTAKKTVKKAHAIEPIYFAMGSVGLAVLLVLGAIGGDVYRLLH